MKIIRVKRLRHTNLDPESLRVSDEEGNRTTISYKHHHREPNLNKDFDRGCIALCKKMGWVGTFYREWKDNVAEYTCDNLIKGYTDTDIVIKGKDEKLAESVLSLCNIYEKEGEGEIPADTEQKIRDFVANHDNLDDSDFHAFVQGLGIDPHEAEEVIYRYTKDLASKKSS